MKNIKIANKLRSTTNKRQKVALYMKLSGQTKIPLGAQVKLKTSDELNGLTGTTTHPFAFGETKKGWIGIYLDPCEIADKWGGKINVKQSEIILL